VAADFIRTSLGLDEATLSAILSDLLETQTVIAGVLIRGQPAEQVCDADNFDTLLRMARRKQAPAIEPRDIRELALALARFQGLTDPGDAFGDLASCLQPLLCLALPAGLWETEILPARFKHYDPQWLDRLMHESALMWVGRQRQRVAFCHADDIDLMMNASRNDPQNSTAADPPSPDATRLFPDRRGRYRLPDLSGDPPRPVRQVLQLLWDGVWGRPGHQRQHGRLEAGHGPGF
jgi:ATP-dependent Lhr-like helicase